MALGVSRRDVLGGLAALVGCGMAASAGLGGTATPALADEGSLSSAFKVGSIVTDDEIADDGEWDYLLVSGASIQKTINCDLDATLPMGGVEYRNGFQLRNDKSNGANIYFKIPSGYEAVTFAVGPVDGGEDGQRTLLLYLNDLFFDEYTVSSGDPVAYVTVSLGGATSIGFSMVKDTSALMLGVAEVKLHADGAFMEPFALDDGVPAPEPAASAAGAEFVDLPDGDYSAGVDDGGREVVVRVSIAGGAIASLQVESDTGTCSIAALVDALTQIGTARPGGAAGSRSVVRSLIGNR